MAIAPQDADGRADSSTPDAPRHGAAAPRGQDGSDFTMVDLVKFTLG